MLRQHFLSAAGLLLLILISESEQGYHERRLLGDLRKKYEPLERPVENEADPLEITFGLTLQQIIDVDEKNQLITSNVWLDLAWVDWNLRWEPEAYGNITSIRVPPNKVWKPDILMYNSADESFDATYETNFVVMNTGLISYIPPGLFKSTCKIAIRWFPFDEQQCKMKFGSWTHDGRQIILKNKSHAADLSGFAKNGEWDLLEMPAVQNVILYDCCPDTPYYDVTFTLRIRRRSLYYAFNLIIPCVLISSMALLSFTLPPDAGEKIGLGVTILLSLTVFMLLVADKLPETSEAVPLIGVYFANIMAMCSVSLMFTVLVLNFHHRTPDTHRLPIWVKTGINQWLAWVLRMSRPGHEESRADIMERARSNKMSRDESTRSLISNQLYDGNSNSVNFLHSQHQLHMACLRNNAAVPNSLSLQRLKLEQNQHRGSPVRLANIKQDSLQSHHSDYSSHASQVSTTCCSRPELQLIFKELKYISDRYREEDRASGETSDWVFAAMVIDRLCLIMFTILTILSTCVILLSAPNAFHQS